MPSRSILIRVFVCLGLVALAAGGCSPAPGTELVWESTNIVVNTKMGEVTTRMAFKLKNRSRETVVIQDVLLPCGCTIAQLPSKPWRLGSKESGKLDVLVDLREKSGELSKEIYVVTTNTSKATNFTNFLRVTVNIPEGFTNGMTTATADRLFGQQLSGLDRQAVFKNDCVRCHLVPAFGKTGESLYRAACGICHEAKDRAKMVPDLRTLKSEIDPTYWRQMVEHGKPGTLMPASAAREGGSLDDAQMDSLVAYLTNAFPRPIKQPAAPPTPKKAAN